MNDRLRRLIERGHGDCLEAIRLEEDPIKKMAKLRKYIETRPESTQIRRARKLLKDLENDRPRTRRHWE